MSFLYKFDLFHEKPNSNILFKHIIQRQYKWMKLILLVKFILYFLASHKIDSVYYNTEVYFMRYRWCKFIGSHLKNVICTLMLTNFWAVYRIGGFQTAQYFWKIEFALGTRLYLKDQTTFAKFLISKIQIVDLRKEWRGAK